MIHAIWFLQHRPELETKARMNHRTSENRNSAANLRSPRQKDTLGSKYNAFSAWHHSEAAGVAWLEGEAGESHQGTRSHREGGCEDTLFVLP